MPYSKGNVPPSASKLKGKALDIFIAVTNEMLKSGSSEGEAIAGGLSRAKQYKEKNKRGVKKSAQQEQMIAIEVVYEPDTPDLHNQWMSVDTLKAACSNFNSNLESGFVKSNLFHAAETELFTITKTWIQPELDVVVEGSNQPVKAGSWLAEIQYHDPVLWEMKKAGELGGVSLGGVGMLNEETGEITELRFDTMLGEKDDTKID